MKRFATTLSLFLAALALSLAPSLALAISVEPADRAEDVTVDYVTQQPVTPSSVAVSQVVFDNTAGTTLTAFSSTDLASIWGDELFTTQQGTLSGFKFSIFNSGSSAGTLTSANVSIQFYDGGTFASLGGFSTTVTFSTPLAKGTYSVINVTSLDALSILLTNTDIIVTQKVNSKTGAASRLGFVSATPIAIGSSDVDFYASSTTIGPAGWYTSGTTSVTPIYQVTAADLPVPTNSTTWGRIKTLYR